MRIAIAISNAELVSPTWTTVHLAHHALAAGYAVRLLEPRDLEVTARGQLMARVSVLDGPSPGTEVLARRIGGHELPRRYMALTAGDLLLLRVNPLPEPLLSLLLVAQDQGVEVLNDPLGVALTRSKAWLATLSDVPRPLTLVTQSRASARLFVANLDHGAVVKPAVSSGGRGVTLVSPSQVERLDEAMEAAERICGGPVIVQAYLPEAEEGEKRLVWLDGEILGGYLRRRSPGEFRHNLRCGATPLPCVVNAADHALSHSISPHLRRNGIRLAGLDVIGDRVVEVNTCNPGGVHYAELLASAPRPDGPLGRIILRRLTSPSVNLPEACPA